MDLLELARLIGEWKLVEHCKAKDAVNVNQMLFEIRQVVGGREVTKLTQLPMRRVSGRKVEIVRVVDGRRDLTRGIMCYKLNR
jgi:hypothetical protein